MFYLENDPFTYSAGRVALGIAHYPQKREGLFGGPAYFVGGITLVPDCIISSDCDVVGLSFGKPGEREGYGVGRDASRVPVILINPRLGPVVNIVSGYRRVGTGVPGQFNGSRCIRRRGTTPAIPSASSTIGD